MKTHHRGWASLDLGWTLLTLAVVVSLFSGKIQEYIQEKNWQVEAKHIGEWSAAARAYAGRNYAVLLNASATTTPVVITSAMLKATGFLPAGYTETNSQGQQLQANVVRNAQNPQLLQGMVISSGGTAYPLKALIIMAKNIRVGFGGYITDGQTATGSLRSWSIPLSEYGAASGNGHIAVLLSTDELTSAQEDSDRLYRFQVNGRPDLNKMHTSVDMGANNVNNVDTINGVNGVFSSEVRGANGNFSLNVTAAGQVKGGNIFSESDIWANRHISANGQVTGTSLRANSNLYAGGVLQLEQVNYAGNGCYPNGLISRDASGAVLSCQSGVWRAQSGKPRFTPYTYTNYATSHTYMNIGVHDFCTSQYGNENDRDDSWRGVEQLSDGSWRINVKDGSETAMCLDW